MYAVIGAGGFLGSYIIKSILEKTEDTILAAVRSDEFYGKGNARIIPCVGDLTQKGYRLELCYKINSVSNTKVIYTAAVHNIDEVAKNPKKAAEFNIDILDEMISSLYSFDKLLFASSDTVYGEGGKYRFSEKDSLNPLSIYGQQKVEGEKIIVSHSGTALRLPLMFSPGLSPYKKHFCDKVIDSISKGETVSMAVNSIRSTLDYGTVADIIVALCEKKEPLPPIINIAGDMALTKYELGLFLAKKMKIDSSEIIPTVFDENYAKGAVRAASTLMDNSLLKSIIGQKNIYIKL